MTFFSYQPTFILRVLQTYFYPTLPRSSLQNKVHFLDKNIQSSSCWVIIEDFFLPKYLQSP